MSQKAAIILQARMGSSRLPGKSMATIGGRTLVARAVERLSARSGLPVVLATTTGSEDDVLVEEAASLGIPVVRGPADDVLARFVLVASTRDLVDFVRATADNPAVDIDAPRRVLELRRRTGADHVVEYGLPYGAAVEAVSSRALVRAAALATDPYDREHVTPFIRRDRRFVALPAIAPSALRRSELRFTVDTPEDLEFMRLVYALAGPSVEPPSLTRLMVAADQVRAASGPEAPEADAR